jgi:hypothetical protein
MFIRLPLKEKLLMGEAVFYLLWYSFLIYFIPFRWWEKEIGHKMQPIEGRKSSSVEKHRIEKVRMSVIQANKLLFGLGKCFAMSLSIKRMLEGQGVDATLCLGVRKNKFNHLLAHAWVNFGNHIIYGGTTASVEHAQLLTYSQESIF